MPGGILSGFILARSIFSVNRVFHIDSQPGFCYDKDLLQGTAQEIPPAQGRPGQGWKRSMSGIYEKELRLLTADTDMWRHLRPSVLAGFLQSAATAHAGQLGAGTQATLDRGVLWIVARMAVEIRRMPGLRRGRTAAHLAGSCAAHALSPVLRNALPGGRHPSPGILHMAPDGRKGPADGLRPGRRHPGGGPGTGR